MKILGIGNAIVDVICKVNDSFIEHNNLTKSTMKLFFNENEFKQLLINLKIEKTVSGGSVANSIVGLSQLGDKVGFIGKEIITLNHEAFDRTLYSDGALSASKWLMKKKPGLYSMRDLLNFS